ncbi:somatomedin-B and thrombospondin type-1 domain-containing protein isoform X2 [Bactrocera tryoni]|uniref:somatomedin-B and thrombospondin type-1 domain-containing protein isoform X2 n=1 Tax=Bactrocera tryoni TaxID=59916 RepID=UPI001A9A27E7|nr:somatomedin-B and thrombospondin type-1 domain-containing protein isoform X2 [Bactrocera tryoni]
MKTPFLVAAFITDTWFNCGNSLVNFTEMCTTQSTISPTCIIFVLSAIRTEKMHYRCFHITALLLELLIVAVLLLQPQSVSAGSCREAQLCCNGRDSSCVVQKTPINAIIEDLNEKPCYCDHACLKLGDCCTDFKDHCRVVDCQVSEWTAWSECDKSCGTGVMLRTRKIIRAPQNGGKHCPSLTQKKSCLGIRCHTERGKRIFRENAVLLPSSVFYNYNSNTSKESLRQTNNLKSYCIEFEVINAAKECNKIAPYNFLLEGDRISVRCNIRKMSNKLTLWNDEMNIAAQNFTLRDTNRVAKLNAPRLMPRNSAVHNNNIKYRENTQCRGEGATGRSSWWRASAIPSCQGKWLRLTLETAKCSHTHFEFA